VAPTTEAKRDALVHAAYREIAANGFEGLRTREVAAAVGVNIATLHYYFPSKEDLIRGVVGFALTRFQTTLPARGEAHAQLRQHFQGLRRLAREEPELFKVMGELAQRAARDRGMAEMLRKMDDVWSSTLRTLLRRAVDSGAIAKTVDPEDMSALIVSMLKGVYLLPAASANVERLERPLRQMERLLGLRATRVLRQRPIEAVARDGTRLVGASIAVEPRG
jgi:AcrR family transcriptional regulator